MSAEKSDLCRSGELCEQTRHRFVDGVYQTCSCFYFLRRDEWFVGGGFPRNLIGVTAEDAITKSRIGLRTADQLRKLGRGIVRKPPPKPILIEGTADASPLPIAAYLAYQVAIASPVLLTTVADLVEEQFEDSAPKTARARNTNCALFLRLGTDRKHSYTSPMLQQLLIHRSETDATTIVISDRPLESMEGVYTQSGLVVLRTRCARY